MGRARKAAHVAPDLRQNHPRRQGSDARNGDQQADHGLNRGLTGFDRRVHSGDHRIDLPIDPLGRRRQGIDLPKVKPQQEPMVIRHPPPQRLAQLIARRLEPPIGKLGQSARIGFTGDQRLDHRPAAHPQDVGDHAVQLDVGILQRFLDPWLVCSRTNCLRVRNSERSSWIAGSGTKLDRIRP